jgi:hypothetical protein
MFSEIPGTPYLLRSDQDLPGAKVNHGCMREFLGDNVGGKVHPGSALIEDNTVAAGNN